MKIASVYPLENYLEIMYHLENELEIISAT